jgi:hypothetical protein
MKTIIVPAQILQDLIHNAELACAGMGRGEHSVLKQCTALQACIDGGEITGTTGTTVTKDNITFANFGRIS